MHDKEREERKPNPKDKMHFIYRYEDDFCDFVREQSAAIYA